MSSYLSHRKYLFHFFTTHNFPFFSLSTCILGDKCKAPALELWPKHKYPDCGNIVHVLCGSFDEKREKCVCGCKMDPSSKVTKLEYSREHISLVSTITQSTSDCSYKEISRDYFITTDQKTNKKYMSEGGDAYHKIKSDILKEINDSLK